MAPQDRPMTRLQPAVTGRGDPPAPAPDLIIVAYAVAPGPGGPESHVNARFLQALATWWPASVTVITAGASPRFDQHRALAELPNWTLHSLGEAGDAGPDSRLVNRVSAWCVSQLRSNGLGTIPAKIVNRVFYWRTGDGVKTISWQNAARRALRRALRLHPNAVVYSRALPFTSIAAVAAERRRARFPWIVNINDPLPPDVWAGLYQSDPWSIQRMHTRFRALLPLIDAFTFPCVQLRNLEIAAFPTINAVPHGILPHLANPVVEVVAAKDAKEPGSRLRDHDTRLRIAFSGTLRKNRVCDELRTALEALARDAPHVVANIVFSFHLARPTPHADEFISRLPGTTEIVLGEFDEVLDTALGQADVLLDLESVPDTPLLLTKVANYIGIGKPIWAICAPDGTTWNLIQTTGWGYASRIGDQADIAQTLSRIYADWTEGRLHTKNPNQDLVDRFSAQRQIADLSALCTYLTQPRSQPANQYANGSGPAGPGARPPVILDWP